MTRTLILARADIRRLLGHADYLQAVEDGFRASAEGRAESPPPLHIEADAGGLHAKGALMRNGRGYLAVKVNSNFPANAASGDLPTIQGALLLFDASDGALLAVMDSVEITLMRTAAATALASRYLAPSNPRDLAICGCGAQAPIQAAALAQLHAFARGRVFDQNREKAEALASRLAHELGFPVVAVGSLHKATFGSDVIVTCTTADRPFLERHHVSQGTFIAAVGADAPAKNEIASALMSEASIFADVTAQAEVMGDLHHAIAAGAMTVSDVKGELAGLVSGRVAGRTDPDQLIIFDSTGTAIEDVASAALAYERALDRDVPSIALTSAEDERLIECNGDPRSPHEAIG